MQPARLFLKLILSLWPLSIFAITPPGMDEICRYGAGGMLVGLVVVASFAYGSPIKPTHLVRKYLVWVVLLIGVTIIACAVYFSLATQDDPLTDNQIILVSVTYAYLGMVAGAVMAYMLCLVFHSERTQNTGQPINDREVDR